PGERRPERFEGPPIRQETRGGARDEVWMKAGSGRGGAREGGRIGRGGGDRGEATGGAGGRAERAEEEAEDGTASGQRAGRQGGSGAARGSVRQHDDPRVAALVEEEVFDAVEVMVGRRRDREEEERKINPRYTAPDSHRHAC